MLSAVCCGRDRLLRMLCYQLYLRSSRPREACCSGGKLTGRTYERAENFGRFPFTKNLRKLSWLPIKSQLYLRDAVLAFKCMTGSAPIYLSSKFVTRGEVSGRSTRRFQLLQIPLFKSKSGQRTFFYCIVSLWNSLDSVTLLVILSVDLRAK